MESPRNTHTSLSSHPSAGWCTIWVPTTPFLIDSKLMFCGKPCQNRHAFDFFALGLHLHHHPTPPSPWVTTTSIFFCACMCLIWATVHPCMHPCTSHPWGLTYPLSC